MTTQRWSMLAIFGVFFFESSVIGQWIPRIPDIKSTLGLSDSELGLALLAFPLGTMVGLSIAGSLIAHIGMRQSCRIALPLFSLVFIGAGWVSTLVGLMIILIFAGIAIGVCETAMNTEAARIERHAGKRLMSRCHGFWSLGTMVGALMGAAFADASVSVGVHFLVILPLIAVAGFIAASLLPVLSRVDEQGADNSNEGAGSVFRLPHRGIVLLCVMPLGIMMVEGAFIDWSAVFMRDVMSASPWVIGITYSFFSIVMAAVRMAGDTLATRFGDLALVRVSAIAATVGIGLFAFSPNTPFALVAAALCGAGVAVVFPLAVTAAANRSGRSSADNVAALNMIAFSAFLLAPPLIGFLSDALNLRVALAVLVPFAFLTFVLSGQIKPRSND